MNNSIFEEVFGIFNDSKIDKILDNFAKDNFNNTYFHVIKKEYDGKGNKVSSYEKEVKDGKVTKHEGSDSQRIPDNNCQCGKTCACDNKEKDILNKSLETAERALCEKEEQIAKLTYTLEKANDALADAKEHIEKLQNEVNSLKKKSVLYDKLKELLEDEI